MTAASRVARAATALLVLATLAGTLAWFDVLPGGWTLRGWLEPHAKREARARAEHRRERLALFAETAAEAPAGAVVFLGSSTIERFPLAASFPGVPCVERGIGDEDARGLLERLERSLPPAPLAGAVLYLASVDFRRHGAPPEAVRARAAAVVDALRGRQADLPLALIGILPERDMAPALVERLAATNAALAGLCAERGVAFVRTDRAPITDAVGALDPACAADHLHLNAAGYRALAGWLKAEGGALGALLSR
jgi:lysophospholipase L1-like esterase